MKDIVILAVLVSSLAAWVTVHVFMTARLALRTRPRWRGLLAFAVPPLAPLWSWREGWRRSSSLWIASVVVYLIGLVAASR